MAVTDLFNTDLVNLYTEEISEPDEYGFVECQEVLFKENIKSAVNTITTHMIQQKYGITMNHSFEVSMDYVDGFENAKYIEFENKRYKVKTFMIDQQFMILPKSITFLVEEVE